jgi:hypothetical protein
MPHRSYVGRVPVSSLLPYARTNDEAYLYMSLRHCLCGEGELTGRTIVTESGDALTTKRFGGSCAGCGRERRFRFQMPATSEVSFEIRYGVGEESSQLLDAGEWLGAAELYAAEARERLDAGEPADDQEITRTYYLLASALAATEEALKFLPSGEDSLPEGAFWTPAGRILFETVPEGLTRRRLHDQRETLRRRVTDFENRYGSG